MTLGLLALGLLAGCEMPSGQMTAGPVARADAPAALANRLPASAAGFQRGATVPVTRPQQGTEVNYATEGRRAAAFVQVLSPVGAAPSIDGPDAPQAQAEFQRWVAESARGQGPARRLSVASEFNEPASAPLMRCAAMEGTYGRQPVQSLVCVGAAGGKQHHSQHHSHAQPQPQTQTQTNHEGVDSATKARAILVPYVVKL